MSKEKKAYAPPAVRTVECFCSASTPVEKPHLHQPLCPVARIGQHQILRPDDFIELYGEVLSGLLGEFIELFPQSDAGQIRSDLDLMLAPICPRCYERDGSIVQSSGPRCLCVPCSMQYPQVGQNA